MLPIDEGRENAVGKTKRLVISAILVALGTALGIAENMLQLGAGIFPGGKLGLANIVTLAALYLFGGGTALSVAVVRAILTCAATGMSSLPFSLSGAVLSVAAMWAAKQYLPCSEVGVSMIGACMHNLAGVTVSALLLSNPYLYTYFPILLLFSLISGILTGGVAQLALRRLESVRNERGS